MSPRRVLAEHSSRDLTEWRAFDAAFGLGVEDDIRAGEVAAAVWNAAGGVPEGAGQKAKRRPASPADFFPKLATDNDEDRDRSSGRGRVSHDDVDDASPVDDEVEVDEDAEVARVSEAMRNMWAMYGLKRNAQLRAAAELETGDPPADADLN